MPTSFTWASFVDPEPIPPAPITDQAAGFPPSAYARQLKELLPRGAVWFLESGSKIERVLLAIADELSRIDARGLDLINESDPRTADETIGDWERILSLPDERVTEISTDLAERRVAITQKYTAGKGQNIAFYVALGLACGYVITISRFTTLTLRVGFRVSDRCYGYGYAGAFQINVSPPAGAALTHAQLEAVIQHVTHAHITVVFNYL